AGQRRAYHRVGQQTGASIRDGVGGRAATATAARGSATADGPRRPRVRGSWFVHDHYGRYQVMNAPVDGEPNIDQRLRRHTYAAIRVAISVPRASSVAASVSSRPSPWPRSSCVTATDLSSAPSAW